MNADAVAQCGRSDRFKHSSSRDCLPQNHHRVGDRVGKLALVTPMVANTETDVESPHTRPHAARDDVVVRAAEPKIEAERHHDIPVDKERQTPG